MHINVDASWVLAARCSLSFSRRIAQMKEFSYSVCRRCGRAMARVCAYKTAFPGTNTQLTPPLCFRRRFSVFPNARDIYKR